LWTYNPPNTDQLGDDWNGENFSWFSRSRSLPPSLLYHDQDAPSLDQGGRILNAIVRPYPAKVAGVPVRFEYEMNLGSFEFEWVDGSGGGEGGGRGREDGGGGLSGPVARCRETEIFVPSLLTMGRRVIVEGLNKDEGDRWAYDEKRQTLFVVVGEQGGGEGGGGGKRYWIRVSVSPALEAAFEVKGFWDEFGGRIVSLSVVVIGVLMFWVLMLLTEVDEGSLDGSG